MKKKKEEEKEEEEKAWWRRSQDPESKGLLGWGCDSQYRVTRSPCRQIIPLLGLKSPMSYYRTAMSVALSVFFMPTCLSFAFRFAFSKIKERDFIFFYFFIWKRFLTFLEIMYRGSVWKNMTSRAHGGAKWRCHGSSAQSDIDIYP